MELFIGGTVLAIFFGTVVFIIEELIKRIKGEK